MPVQNSTVQSRTDQNRTEKKILSQKERKKKKEKIRWKTRFSTGLCGKVGGKPKVFNKVFNKPLWKSKIDTEEDAKMGCRKMLFCCPYYESNGRKILHCEGGQLSLPDRGTRRQYYNEYCGDVNGWRRCTVARAITRFYEAEE